MVKLSDWLVAVRAVGTPESVTINVKVYVPAHDAFGVPVSELPDAEFTIDRQDGSAPLASVHVYGAIPPVTVRVAE